MFVSTAAVGAVGVPVNCGDAKGAFDAICWLLLAIAAALMIVALLVSLMSAHVADPEVDIILFNEKKKYNVQLHTISKFYFVIFVFCDGNVFMRTIRK